MANYQKMNVSGTERVELHDKIGLTGAEISVNVLPAGACAERGGLHYCRGQGPNGS